MEDSDDGRDPSFLAGPEPIPEPWKKPITVVPKNLCNSEWKLVNCDQYKVFLRIKPGAGDNKTQLVLDNHTLLTTVPKESVTYKVLSSRNNSNLQRKFGFTSILDETTSQNDMFKECVLKPLRDFLRGDNSSVMAFGTTSAGKTYTMQGTPDHPGIIPRALTYIFRSLEGKLEESAPYQPYRGSQLISLKTDSIDEAKKFKHQILSLDLSKYQKFDSSQMPYKSFSQDDEAFRSEAYEEIQNQINFAGDDTLFAEHNDQFSIWMSMVEIYNEVILDLLQFPNEKGPRPSLSLGEDETSGFYVKNAQQIQVRSGHEAYQISQFGRLNLHRAATALNDKSSRSHCILTLSLVRRQQNSASCNRISFIDLAGSERVKKTLNDGKRLIESNCINKSLSVLGKCLQALKINQSGKANRIIPVRDSKLTLLFKNALLGLEKLTFIINISSDPKLFDETLHVLKFSALAQEIVPKAQPAGRATRFSQMFQGSFVPSFALNSFPSVSDLTDKSDDFNRMKEMLDDAERRVGELEREKRSYRRDIKELEDCLSKSEERAESLVALLTKKEEDLKTVQSNMISQVHKIMSDKKKENTSDLEHLRKRLNREMDEVKTHYKEQIKTLEEDNKQLKSCKKHLKELLDEAAQDYRAALDENMRLRKTLQDQDEDAVDLESYKIQIEELSLNLAATQEKLKFVDDERARLEAETRNRTDEDTFQNLQALTHRQDEEITKLVEKLQQLENEILLKDDETKGLKQELDQLAGVWLDSNLVNGYEANHERLKALENLYRETVTERDNLKNQISLHKCESDFSDQVRLLETKYRDAIYEGDDLKKQLLHEREVKEFLENECEILKKSVKEMCTKEKNMLNEISALKAAIESLEKEASIKQTFAHGKLMEKIAVLSAEKSALEQNYAKSQEEIKRIMDEHGNCVNKLKSLEVNLQTTQKKLEVAEYQKKIYETFKEKANEENKTIPELKETIERLENELINKEHEFLAFENARKLLIAQHEIELEKYREESDRLKKEVDFGRDYMLENLKSSAKKDEVKSLQDQLTTMKFALRENYMERSPLRNRTNFICPVGNFVDISPFHKLPLSEMDEENPRLSRIFCSLDNLTADALKTPLKPVGRESFSLPTTPEGTFKSAKKSKARKTEKASAKKSTRGRRESVTPSKSARGVKTASSDIFDQRNHGQEGIKVTPLKELNRETSSLPCDALLKSKTAKKPRTARKRDPGDHPALTKSTRGRRRSVSPAKPVDEKVKKQLFSCDDFVDLSDDEENIPVVTSPENKRALRPRTRRNLNCV